MALVASLVLTIKASNDPTHDESVSENPTGRAGGHLKVAAGSSSYRQAPPPYPYKPPKYNSEPHYHDTYEDRNDVSDQEHPMPPVMTEDNAMMLSEELTDAPESNKAMIDEISERDEMISIHEFKEALKELVKEAVDKIVEKKAGLLGKLKTAKQNFIAHDGEATGRDPQQFEPNRNLDDCQCDQTKLDGNGRGACNHKLANGKPWCFLHRFSACHDEIPSIQLRGVFWSHAACSVGNELVLR